MPITPQTQALLDALNATNSTDKPDILSKIGAFSPALGQMTTAAVTIRDRLRSAQMAETEPEIAADFEMIAQAAGAMMRAQGDLDRALNDVFVALQSVERYAGALDAKVAGLD